MLTQVFLSSEHIELHGSVSTASSTPMSCSSCAITIPGGAGFVQRPRPPSGVLQPYISNNVGLPPAPVGGSASKTFRQMLRPDLDPTRQKCAFTGFLNIWNKRTDDDDLGFQYRGDTAAFVLEIES